MWHTSLIPTEMNVKVDVIDMNGRHVETLVNGNLNGGFHKMTWYADYHASGLYFVKMSVGGEIKVKKIMLMK